MSMVNKIKSMLRGHEDKAAKGIDIAGNMFDRRTRGKYRRHVGKAQRKLKDELARPESERRQDGREPGGPGSPGDRSSPGGPYGDQNPYGGPNPYRGQGGPPQN
jgi:hypothetical protein